MARPKLYTEERVTTAVRLPKSTHDRLKKAARERGVSANHLVMAAVDDLLDNLKPPEEISWRKGA